MGHDIMAEVKIIPPTARRRRHGHSRFGRARRSTLQSLATAHTDNDLTVWDETFRHIVRRRPCRDPHVPVLDGSILGWLTVMDDLALIPAKRVVPGHGPVIDDWPDALAARNDAIWNVSPGMFAVLSHGDTALCGGAPPGGEKDRWTLFEEYNARNATAAFAELEWE